MMVNRKIGKHERMRLTLTSHDNTMDFDVTRVLQLVVAGDSTSALERITIIQEILDNTLSGVAVLEVNISLDDINITEQGGSQKRRGEALDWQKAVGVAAGT